MQHIIIIAKTTFYAQLFHFSHVFNVLMASQNQKYKSSAKTFFLYSLKCHFSDILTHI